MNDVTDDKPQQHQYILHAVWTVEEDHHGQKQSRTGHRVIHSTWEGEWDERAVINNFVEQEHPEWLPEGFGQIGLFQDSVELTSVTIFKLAPGSTRDGSTWWEWLKETKMARALVDNQREHAADMATIKRLQEKWGLLEQAEEG